MPGRPWLLALAPIAAAAVAGCHPRVAAPPPPPAIAFIATPPQFGARSFNDGAAAGLAACARETGATIAVATPDPGAVQPDLVLAATQNRDTIVALGAAMAPEVVRAARRFQNAHFALVDGVADEANVDAIAFKDEEGAYLAGALAAMMSPHRRVAFLGGADEPRVERSEAGFTAGAHAIDPRLAVETRFVGSFTDRAAAGRLAAALYARGADVVFAVAGPAGAGAIAAAAGRRGAYAIGADADQDALAPGHVLTSVVEHVDRVVRRVCEEAAAQKPASGRRALGLAEGAVSLTDLRFTRAAIGAARLARLARLRDAIVAGTIRPPASRVALAQARPPAVRR